MCQAAPAEERPRAAQAGVPVSPEEIAASLPPPQELDEFWNARRTALAALPLQADLKSVEGAAPEIECFRLEISCPQTNPVRAYGARPTAAKAQSCPASR